MIHYIRKLCESMKEIAERARPDGRTCTPTWPEMSPEPFKTAK
jgi:hypothetical protein